MKKEAEENIEKLKLESIVSPAKVKFLSNHTFRQSGPAIIGVEVLGGKIKKGMVLAKNGKRIGVVKSLKLEKDQRISLKMIKLSSPIKKPGKYSIPIQLAEKTKAKLKLVIEKK